MDDKIIYTVNGEQRIEVSIYEIIEYLNQMKNELTTEQPTR